MAELTVDGRRVEARDGELLLDALRREGLDVPTRCHDDRLDPYGGCRLCLVSLDGAPRPVPACAERVREGMVVSTNGATGELRGTIEEMLEAELSGELASHREPHPHVNALLAIDPEKCILCARCVRYTREVMQCSALTFEGRGAETRVVPTHGASWLDTECELCGGCMASCPTGAIYPVAAPADDAVIRKVRTTCTYCGVGCQLDLNVDARGRIVKVTSDQSYLPNRGDLCVKGRFAFNFVHHPERLTAPLVRGEDGELHEATWDVALDAAARGLLGAKERHGAQSVGVLSSARLTMEENYLIQKLARGVVGTNSVHSCEAT